MSKNSFYKWTIAVLIISNLLLISFTIYNNYSSQSFDPDKPKKIIIERLHFDKQQIAQYEILVQEHITQIKSKDKEIRKLKDALYALLPEENNELQADSLISLLVEKQKEIEYIHFKHFTDIKKLCKPEQMADYRKLVKELTQIFKFKPRTQTQK